MNDGLDVIWSSGNIAIVVLMVVVLMQQVLIGFLLRGLLNMKDTLSKLNEAMILLVERIGHGDH